MKKKEFAVGETFQFGRVRLKAIEGNCCAKCFLCRHEVADCSPLVGRCNALERTDKKEVIFVEVFDDGTGEC